MVRYRGEYPRVRRLYCGPKLVDEITLIVRGGWLPRSCAISRSIFVTWAVSRYTFGAAKKSVKTLRNVLSCVNIFVTTSQDTHSRTLHRALVERCRPRSAKSLLQLFVVPRDMDMPECWDETAENPAPKTLAGSNSHSQPQPQRGERERVANRTGGSPTQSVAVTNTTTTAFATGNRVLAKQKGRPREHSGVIAGANKDGTYHVMYNDGDAEERVAAHLIRLDASRPPPWKEHARPLTECGPPVDVTDKIVAIQFHRVRLGLGPGDIGVFGDHRNSTGSEFLDGVDNHRPSIAQVQEIIASVGGQVGASFSLGTSPLTKKELARLKATVDTAFEEHHARHPFTGDCDDHKLALDRSQLEQIIGATQVKRLLTLFGRSPPTEILLRRCKAHGKCIRFHTDHSLKTLQVSLTDDDTYSGGKLVYLTDSGLHCPKRGAGTFTLHRGDVVHGVSRLRSGTRYGLFFLQQDEDRWHRPYFVDHCDDNDDDNLPPLCGSL